MSLGLVILLSVLVQVYPFHSIEAFCTTIRDDDSSFTQGQQKSLSVPSPSPVVWLQKSNPISSLSSPHVQRLSRNDKQSHNQFLKLYPMDDTTSVSSSTPTHPNKAYLSRRRRKDISFLTKVIHWFLQRLSQQQPLHHPKRNSAASRRNIMASLQLLICFSMGTLLLSSSSSSCWAVESGGRVGGGSFRSSSNRQQYSSSSRMPSSSRRPTRTYSRSTNLWKDGNRIRPYGSGSTSSTTTILVNPWNPFTYSWNPFYYYSSPSPIYYGSSSDGALVVVAPRVSPLEILVMGGIVYFIVQGLFKNTFMDSTNMDETDILDSVLGPGISLAKITVAIQVPHREDDPSNILHIIQQVASTTNTQSSVELQAMIHQVALTLLRKKQSIVASSTQYKHFTTLAEAQKVYNQWSIQERSKFERETGMYMYIYISFFYPSYGTFFVSHITYIYI